MGKCIEAHPHPKNQLAGGGGRIDVCTASLVGTARANGEHFVPRTMGPHTPIVSHMGRV